MAGPDLTIDATSTPRVEVFHDPGDLHADAATLRVYRFSEDRTWLVRGGVDITVGEAVLDWECPFQTNIAYRSEQFDSDGVSLGFTDAATTVVDVDDVWVQNPLEPTSAVNLGPLALLGSSLSPNIRPLVGDVDFPDGQTLGQWSGGGRRGLVGAPIGFAVETVDDMYAIQSMLGTYETRKLGVLLIRTPPPVMMPRTFFAAVAQPDARPRNVNWGGQRSDFVFTATEVQPPFPGLTQPFLTYADLEAAYSTYAELEAAYSTYSEMQRDYSIAGLAG